MAIMKEQTWEKHSNPWSMWTRVLTNPLVYVPVWNRSWRQAIPVLYALVWCTVALVLVVLDRRFWRGSAPAGAATVRSA